MQLSLNLCIRTLSALADSTEARTGFTWQFVYTVNITNFGIQIWVGLPFQWSRTGKHHYFSKRLFRSLYHSSLTVNANYSLLGPLSVTSGGVIILHTVMCPLMYCPVVCAITFYTILCILLLIFFARGFCIGYACFPIALIKYV